MSTIARPTRRATINDVAGRAGVSRQTVTRAMNDMPGISKPTKQSVLAAAHELGYRPSRFGRGLAKASSDTLGLVVHDLTNPWYPELASAIMGEAAVRGWKVVLGDTRFAREHGQVMARLAEQADVLIGYWPPIRLPALDALPQVRIDVDPGSERAGVVLDLVPAMTEAVTRLLGRGVQAPLLLDISRGEGCSPRLQLAEGIFRGHGVGARRVRCPESVVEAAATVSALIEAGERFDAVLGFNDLVAAGALQACLRSGLDVPAQVAVVGVDGLPLGGWLTPRLTTLALDLAEVARHAVDLGIGMSQGEQPWSGGGVHRRVEHRLLVRESG